MLPLPNRRISDNFFKPHLVPGFLLVNRVRTVLPLCMCIHVRVCILNKTMFTVFQYVNCYCCHGYYYSPKGLDLTLSLWRGDQGFSPFLLTFGRLLSAAAHVSLAVPISRNSSHSNRTLPKSPGTVLL